MFSDIGSTWKGVLEDMSDVKELVPEMFYLPEVLVNVNNINLGRTQKGEQLGDVKLPPWAKNPVDFVQKHRLALESPHVSAHLHEWIDLIFGYKQRGKEAIAANNVFFYMTYEGAVDIDKITDPVIRKGTQDQISYFGQTPSQLLTSPHIKRLPIEDVLHLQTIFRNPSAVQCYTAPFPERCNVPSGAICATRDFVVTVDMKAPACAVAVHKWQPHTPDGHGLPFLFQHGKPATSSAGGALSRMFSRQTGLNTGEWRYPRAIAFAAPGAKSSQVIAITPDACLLTGGHADSSLKLVVGENARTVETASGHSAPITCLSLSPDGAICVTGSRDSTAILWRVDSSSVWSSSTSMLEASSSTNSGPEHFDGGFPEIKRTRIEGPLHVLRGHVDEITSCCANADLDIAVSFSETAGVILHSVSSGRCLRRLPFKAVDFMALSSEGIIILWDRNSRNLSTVTLNGVLLSTLYIDDHEGDVSNIAVSMDGRYAVVGTTCAKYQPPDTSWYAHSSVGVSDISPQIAVDDQSDPVDSVSNGSEFKGISKGEAAWDLYPRPSIFLLDVNNLEVLHKIKLQAGQDVTAIALNNDSTNMVVSTADGQLFVYTDPALSLKVVDQMLRLGWQGAGLAVQIS